MSNLVEIKDLLTSLNQKLLEAGASIEDVRTYNEIKIAWGHVALATEHIVDILNDYDDRE